MLSLKYIRENKEKVIDSIAKKNSIIDIPKLIELDVSKRNYLQNVEQLRSEKNKISSNISKLKKNGEDADQFIIDMQKLSIDIKNIESELIKLEKQINKILYFIPNMVHKSVPIGKDSKENIVVKEWGEKIEFSYKPKDHLELGKDLGLFNFIKAANISGSGFALYTNKGALLERALINLMLDLHTTKNEYSEIFPPFLVNPDAMFNTGQLPKFEDDMYKIYDDKLFCIPTAEVPLTNIHQGELFNESELPKKYAAYSACFRREAGSYGKDTRGLTRLHQFNKVELVKFVNPNSSYDELELLLQDAEAILQTLNLHYRIIELCSGDLSFSAAKCYDIEVWSPVEKKYLEVSSCSNFEDFQSRRANIRYRNLNSGKLEFIHTLNGSGLATPRLMIALLESNQQIDGSIILPDCLHTYTKIQKLF